MSEATPPPATEQSKLVAPAPSVRMVKIKTLRDIRIGDTFHPSGKIIEVTEADAAEFADKEFEGVFSRSGENSDWSAESERHKIRRAERVK